MYHWFAFPFQGRIAGSLSHSRGQSSPEMHISGSKLKRVIRRGTIAVLAFSLAGCEFQAAITPISWATVPPQPFQSGPVFGTPAPSPVPIAPSPSPPPPTPIPFQRAADLDCEGPIGGDNQYGYCSIPDSDLYYVWGECAVPCPNGQYPGIEIRIVEDSSEFRDFAWIIGQRDVQLDKRRDSGGWAAIFAAGDVIGGMLAWKAAECIVAGHITGGASCIGLLVTLGVGVGAATKMGADYFTADHELNREHGLNDQARDNFEDLQASP